MVRFEQASKMYKLNVGSYPSKLADLQVQPAGMKRITWGGPYLKGRETKQDPWGNTYHYSIDEAKDRVTVSSAGPDGIVGNEDDVFGKR